MTIDKKLILFKNNNEIKHIQYFQVIDIKYVCTKIGTEKLWKIRNVKLLGININNESECDKHVRNCSKTGRKISALVK